MLIIFIRTSIIFITLIFVMRLMGKRQIGEMQPFEFIITLIIAELACIPMSDTSIPLLYGIVSILAIFILHQLLFLLEKSGNFMKKMISGKPSVVINKNGVDTKELKKNSLDIEDLIESLRAKGYFSLDAVDYAIFEANGKLSTLERQNYLSSPAALPVLIINEGKLNHTNIELIKLNPEFIVNFLKEQKSKIKNVDVMTLDNGGKVYLQIKNKKYQILSVNLPKGVQW